MDKNLVYTVPEIEVFELRTEYALTNGSGGTGEESQDEDQSW